MTEDVATAGLGVLSAPGHAAGSGDRRAGHVRRPAYSLLYRHRRPRVQAVAEIACQRAAPNILRWVTIAFARVEMERTLDGDGG